MVRINKYLASKGFATRRGADELIKAGKVKINGRRAVLGDQVSMADAVIVDQKALAVAHAGLVYYAYNKPIGVVTHSPQAGEIDIIAALRTGVDSRYAGTVAGRRAETEVAPQQRRQTAPRLRGSIPDNVFPVGRLDKESHGLILLTNDGRITDRLLHPSAEHEKEYSVQVNKPLKQNTLTRLSKGVKIEDYLTKPATAVEMSPYSLRLTITEGKTHQVRRMLTALGYTVTDLKRMRIMHIKLGDLKAGEYRPLTPAEKKKLLGDLKL